MSLFGIPSFWTTLVNSSLTSGLSSGVRAVGKGTVTVISCALVTEVPGGGVESPEGWGNGWY